MNAEALIGTVLGTCTLQKLIGQGGMGAVYLAQQSRPRRQVAVKVLLPMTPLSPNQLAAFLERFRRETDAAASLEHPNIMPVHEYGEREGLAYLVMPYISGGTLRDQLERENQLPFDKIVNYLDQMAAAIDIAHEKGVIHRDIKPANILLTPEGRLLLTDFGLVKIIAEGQIPQLRLTGPGAPVGTPDYMAPEQVIGEDVDPRADLYSLGVILYQMVTGTTPFQGDSPMQIAAQHLQLPPPSPKALRPDLPNAAEQVILRAMAKRPDDRYSRAQDLANAFRMALVAAGILPDISSLTSSMARIPASTTTGRMFAPKDSLDLSRRMSSLPGTRKDGVQYAQKGLLQGTGMLPTVANNSPAASDRDLLQGTGMQPSVTGNSPAAGGGGLLQGTGILPSVTSNLPAANGGGLLSRTGMRPAIARNGPADTATASPNPASLHQGSRLLSRTGKFPLAGTASSSMPSTRTDEMLKPAGAQSLFGTDGAKSPFAPQINEAGNAALADQQGNPGMVKLTGPVKVVKVPVAGQPGQYVTGLLPVSQEEAGTSSTTSERKPRMKLWIKVVTLVLVVALILAGIGVAFLLHAHSAPHSGATTGASSMTSTQSSAANAANANIIVSDPLDRQINNWLTSPADTFAFKDGAYHITDHGSQGRASILQGHTFDNTSMVYSLTMEEINGNDSVENNTFGMIFRFNTSQSGNRQITTFYSFEVENTDGGYYRFWKYDDTNATSTAAWTDLWHTKVGPEFHEGHGPKATNVFKVAMNGGSFTFIVNGKTVGKATNNALTGGMIGMTVNLDGTEVAFKNLLITHH
jgi:serine/threonine protein kinase